MNLSRIGRIWAFAFAFVLGCVTRELFLKPAFSSGKKDEHAAAMAGIEKLHELNQRVTLLSDAKALQQEWTNDAVRLQPDAAPDVGKAAIYATDARCFAQSPGFATVSYHPEIRDVKIDGDWAFEWALFDAGFREAANKSIEILHGKVPRVIHRERNGEWKFSRVMVAWDTKNNQAQ